MRRALSFAAVAALLACGDGPTQPSVKARATATWALQSVNGRPLPYRVPLDQYCDVEVVSSELRLDEHARLSYMQNTSRWLPRTAGTVCVGSPGQIQTFTDDHDIIWGVQGDTISINLVFPTFLEEQTGRIEKDGSGDALVLTYRDGFRLPDGEYRYRKTGN